MMVYLFLVSGYFRLIASDPMVEFELEFEECEDIFFVKKGGRGWMEAIVRSLSFALHAIFPRDFLSLSVR